MSSKLCRCGCGEQIPPGRSDRAYVDGAHKQLAYRARATVKQRQRRTVAEASVAGRDLHQILAAAERSLGRTGTAWLRAGGRLHTLSAAELGRLAALAHAQVSPELGDRLDRLVAAAVADREQLAAVVGASGAARLPLQVVHGGQVLGELALGDMEQLAALARVATVSTRRRA